MSSTSRRDFLRVSALAVAGAPLVRPLGSVPSIAHRATPTTSRQEKKLGFALVGLGSLSTNQIAPALQKTKHCRLAGIVTGTPAKAEKWKAQYGIPDRSTYNYDTIERIADNKDVDVVYVVTPNALHARDTIKAAKAGKHVLCEKPIGLSAAQGQELVDAAARHPQLKVMEAFMYRHHPQTHKAAELVAAGAIGELRQVRSRFSFTLDDPADIRLPPELDGGAIMDLGCYCISMQRLLAGEPELVFGRQRTGPTGVDIGFTGVLQFAGDVFGEFHCGFDLPQTNGLEAIGSTGVLAVPDPVRCRDPHVEVDGKRIEVEDVDRYCLQVANFSSAVRGEAEPLLGRDDALGQARSIAALYRSAESGRNEKP